MMDSELVRWLWVGGAVAAFVGTCLWSLWPRRRAHGTADYLVLYASQTGQAEEIARRTQAQLKAGGQDAQVLSLGAVTVAQLAAARVILAVVSTTGDGDAPDEGRAFERGLMTALPSLTGQRFAVLALGDRTYDQFCAFGRRVHAALEASGATAMTTCIDVDDLDAQALGQWDRVLHGLGAATVDSEPTFAPWRLTQRQRLNPEGDAPLFRVRLEPVDGQAGDWAPGDLAEILTLDGHRRDYSIASLATHNHVELYVRAIMDGRGSGLLTKSLEIGATVPLRTKVHSGFHTPQGSGPLLLIGAGSGLAGLRAHALSTTQRRVWLVYGERHPLRDGALCDEARSWALHRLDLAFSQPDDEEGRYVQHVLAAEAQAVSAFLSDKGAVMVCGGLAMGQAVDQALRTVMGEPWVDAALADGRYRRDLY